MHIDKSNVAFQEKKNMSTFIPPTDGMLCPVSSSSWDLLTCELIDSFS